MTNAQQEMPAGEAFQTELPAPGLDAAHAAGMLVGLVFLGVGALFAWLMVWAPGHWQPARPPLAVVFLLPVPGMVIGLLAMTWAIITASESVQLRVEDGALRLTRRGLRGRRVRVFTRGELVNLSLRVRAAANDKSGAATLVARLADKPRQKLFTRYGLAEMTRIRDALCAVLWPERLDPGAALLPPPGGYLTAIADGDALRIHMGPEPVGQVLQGTFYIGMVFAIGAPLFCAALVVVIMSAHPDQITRIIGPVMSSAVAMALCAIGIALAAWARRTALRQADITITPEKLSIEISGPGDPEHHQWSREQIFGVRLGPSGTTVNSQASLQFQVLLQGGRSQALFNGRDQEGLRWLARTIEQMLALKGTEERRTELLATLARGAASAPSPDAVQAGAPALAASTDLASRIDDILRGSNISRVADAQRLILAVAPRGWRRVPIFFIIFTTLWCLMSGFMLVLCLKPSTHTPPTVILFVLPFFGLGLVGFLIMRRLARAAARVELTPQTLEVHWDSALSAQHASVPCAEIVQVKEGVHVDSEGSSPPQLQITRPNAATMGIMTGYGQEELRTLARAISFALALES